MGSIREAVDELHFMANAIRRSSVQSQKFTLSSVFKNTEDFFFESCALRIIINTFPHARQSICKQIATSLMLRRKTLLYRMQHEQKLGTRRRPLENNVSKQHAPSDPIKPLQVLPPQPESPLVHLQMSQAELHGVRTRSVDTRSHLNVSMARQHIARGPALSTISIGSSVRLSSREYPPKPDDFPSGARDCQCPYCARRLSTSKLESHPTYWQ